MRKYYLLISLFAILAMVIAACGSSTSNNTSATATTQALNFTVAPTSPATSAAPGVSASGTPVSGGAAATPTSPPVSAIGVTETAVSSYSTPAAGLIAPVSAGTPGIPGTGLSNTTDLITGLLTLPVVDQNNTQIGMVNDLVLSLCTANIDYAIVTLNGNMPSASAASPTGTPVPSGILATINASTPGAVTTTPTANNGAGSMIAIPWQVMTVISSGMAAGAESTATPAASGAAGAASTGTPSAPGVVSGQGEFLLANSVTADLIKHAPTFNKSTETNNGVFSSGWDAGLLAYWGITSQVSAPQGCSIGGASAAASTGTPGTSGAAATSVPSSPGSGNAIYTGMDLTVLAKSFLGATVDDTAGNNIGSISDGINLPTSGLVRYLILNPGTSLSMSGKLIPVPSHAFSVNSAPGGPGTATPGAPGAASSATPASSGATGMTGTSNIVLTLNVPTSVLQTAPTLNPNNLPNMNTAGWDLNVMQFWSGQNIVVPN
jgi:sporulation protein YlmC with PRC-barrel domain